MSTMSNEQTVFENNLALFYKNLKQKNLLSLHILMFYEKIEILLKMCIQSHNSCLKNTEVERIIEHRRYNARSHLKFCPCGGEGLEMAAQEDSELTSTHGHDKFTATYGNHFLLKNT